MKCIELINLLMKIPSDAEVCVENCMIHDGELAMRKVTELRDCVTNERLFHEEKYEHLPYWLLYGKVGT